MAHTHSLFLGEAHVDISAPTFDLLTLHLLRGVTPRTVRVLGQRGPFADVVAHPADHADILPAEAVQALAHGNARRDAEREAASAERSGVRILGLDDENYPALVRLAHDPPPVLFVRGSLEIGEAERSVAIVGSRAATPAGRAFARCLARDLAGRGITIVSGLARGIDGEAHAGALEARGRTIAVLGSGLDRLYPAEHAALAQATARSGAVVSEFPMSTPPLPEHFPRRNRILATWGKGVVVVEAGEKSGALVTARLALDEGRDVMAVPGHPSQRQSTGTNGLIRDGASLVRYADDVVDELALPVSRPTDEKGAGADPLLALLDPVAPTSLEALAEATGLLPAPLLARLTLLELDGQVRRFPGPLFVRRK
jgi:DNA processing protein